MPKVTIIMPVYNKMPYVQDALGSLRKQTLEDIEILVVDNASTDASPTYLQKCAAEDPRISLYTLKRNIGPSGAYHYAIDQAKGDYLTIIDSDDFVDPDYAETLYTTAIKYHADITMCRNNLYFDENKQEQLEYQGPDELVLHGGEIEQVIPQTICYGNGMGFPKDRFFPETGAVWIKLYRTEFVRANELQYDTDLWMFCDWEFNLKAFSKAKTFAFVNRTMYHYRQLETSVIHDPKYNPNKLPQMMNAINAVCKDCDAILKTKPVPRLALVKKDFIRTCLGIVYSHYDRHLGGAVSNEDMKDALDTIQENANVKGYYADTPLSDVHGMKRKLDFVIHKNKYVRLISLKKALKHAIGK